MAILAASLVILKSIPIPLALVKSRSKGWRNNQMKRKKDVESDVLLTRRGAMAVLVGSLLCPNACAECEYNKMPSGLQVCELAIGSGQAPVPGNVIKLHYKGALENGLVFDNSYDRGEPLTFQLKPKEVMKGVYEAILGTHGLLEPMRPGGKRRVRVPPELGFGNNPGQCPRFWSGPCLVPPNSLLVYDLEYINLYGR